MVFSFFKSHMSGLYGVQHLCCVLFFLQMHLSLSSLAPNTRRQTPGLCLYWRAQWFSVTCSALMWHWLWSARMTAGLTVLKLSYASEAQKSARVTAPGLLGKSFFFTNVWAWPKLCHCIKWEIVPLNNKSENKIIAYILSCFLSQLKITVIHGCKSLMAFKILFCLVIQCRAMH